MIVSGGRSCKQDASKSGFFDLPLEVRMMVYENYAYSYCGKGAPLYRSRFELEVLNFKPRRKPTGTATKLSEKFRRARQNYARASNALGKVLKRKNRTIDQRSSTSSQISCYPTETETEASDTGLMPLLLSCRLV